ncbi:MAG: pentapeptide repeat-containing protein [Thermoleophilia bacterium]
MSKSWTSLKQQMALLRRATFPWAFRVGALSAATGTVVVCIALWRQPGLAVTLVPLVLGLVVPGLAFWWPSRRRRDARTDLGLALVSGAIVAAAVLIVQLDFEQRISADQQRAERALRAQEARLQIQTTLGLHRDLTGIDLHGRVLDGFYLRKKIFRDAVVTDASLVKANLAGVDFRGLTGRRANLDQSVLSRADFRGADLGGARLEGANLFLADARGAFLGAANLDNADLIGACLKGASLRAATLKGASLSGADLRGADLRDADLTGATFGAVAGRQYPLTVYPPALVDRRTLWPSGTDAAGLGVISFDESKDDRAKLAYGRVAPRGCAIKPGSAT